MNMDPYVVRPVTLPTMTAAKPSPLKLTLIMFWAVHVAALAGVGVPGILLEGRRWRSASTSCACSRSPAGYHRYFSHRTFKTRRAFQFVLALRRADGGAAGRAVVGRHHRHHHKHSDTEQDIALAAAQRASGGRTSAGSVGNDQDETDLSLVADFARYPRAALPGPHWHRRAARRAAGAGLPADRRAARAWSGASSCRTVLLWHGTFTINSLAHMFGRRRYATTDDSRNNWCSPSSRMARAGTTTTTTTRARRARASAGGRST